MRPLLAGMPTPLERGGLALLGEGARGFVEILGEIKTLRRGLEHDLAAQLIHVAATHAHGGAHAERRIPDHLVRQPASHLEIFALGRHAIDQIGLEGLLGGEEAAGECGFHREGAAAAIVHEGPVFARAPAARGFGALELRALFGDDQVALQHDADGEAQPVAVRGGDHRLPVDRLGQQVGRMRAPALRPAELQEFLTAAQLALLDVGAAREGAAGAVQDGDLCLVVGVEAMQRVAQHADQLVAEGVELLRAIQCQRDDLAVPLIIHERHRFPLCSRLSDRHAIRQNDEETMAGIRMAATALLSVVLLAGPAATQKKYDPGASDSEIKLGQTMPYSGPLSGFITLAKAEIAYFQMINDQGGVAGRKITMISLDDGFSPPKTVEQTRKLIEDDQVLAISGSLGTSTNAAIQKYLNTRKVPQLFLATGASRWNDPENFPSPRTPTPTYQAESRTY